MENYTESIYYISLLFKNRSGDDKANVDMPPINQ